MKIIVGEMEHRASTKNKQGINTIKIYQDKQRSISYYCHHFVSA